MTRFFPMLIFTLLMLTVLCTSCTPISNQKNNTPTGRISIVTTIFPPYDFAREIAGDDADITMLIPPASESHSYEPTPQDIITLQNCDVFVYVGGDSDTWVKEVLSSMDTGHMQIITLMDCVEIVEEEIAEGMESEDEDEDDGEIGIKTEYDEHIWTSPRNAKQIVQKISDVLCLTDSANAGIYQENTAAYLKKLDELDAAFLEVVSHAARKTMVFGDRFPFRYFVDAYDLDYFAAFPGCSEQTEASAKTIAFLIDRINEEQIPVVFYIEFSNQKMAHTLCESTGAAPLLFHSCHNVSRDEFLSGVTYLDLMNQNVTALKEALH